MLVTGVSREKGIGTAIVKKLAENGASVIFHGCTGYDQDMGYMDADKKYPFHFFEELKNKGYPVFQLSSSDLSCPGEAENVVASASSCMGYIDGMVLNHAYSTSSRLGEWKYEDITKHFTVNISASLMMMQKFHKQLPTGTRGAITLFTSGQYLGPMSDEMAYAVSKQAIIGMCKQASTALAARFPSGRWGQAEDAAKLVHFLQSDYSSWITGEIIASEGGFRRDKVWP